MQKLFLHKVFNVISNTDYSFHNERVYYVQPLPSEHAIWLTCAWKWFDNMTNICNSLYLILSYVWDGFCCLVTFQSYCCMLLKWHFQDLGKLKHTCQCFLWRTDVNTFSWRNQTAACYALIACIYPLCQRYFVRLLFCTDIHLCNHYSSIWNSY